MEVGFKIRRLLVVSVRRGCRSMCNHPFLVGVACCLFLLYRSSPWLFSLLVSASPVVVCTSLLLGTLLSFGQPNIPEIEGEEGSFTHEIAPLKTSLCENAAVVTRIEDCFSERLLCENNKEAEERVVYRGIRVDGAYDVVEKDDVLLENAWPVENTSRDVQFDRAVLKESVSEKSDVEEGKEIGVHDEKIGIEGVSQSHEDGENQYRLIEEEVYHTIEVENGKTEREPSVDPLEIQSESPRKEADEGDDEDDLSMDSRSDHAESSSSDASISDIRPMLDELHPLLDEEELEVADLTHENSDMASEHSDRSKSENLESDEDSKNGEAGNDDDVDDLEEEEEAQGGKEEESKTGITWTADDQKNLMDLGNLELERNMRLENLIARRRARKTMVLMAEKNLIDLDYIDLPFNVPHIATMRQNPFDGSDDSYDSVGLPPIPGSAPSVLLKRRNPFDLPYEPNEEKPDLKGDSFQQEFTTHQQRDAIFCRHESFAVGPSNLGIFRKEKQDLKWRPFFVPEHFAANEPNDHPIQIQLGEVTDSKASSEPDTESVASLTDQDNKNTNELDSSKEVGSVSCLVQDSPRVEDGTESSEDFKSLDVEEAEKDISLQDENVIMLGNVETQGEPESSYSEAMNASLDSNTDRSQSSADTVEHESILIMLGNTETQDEPESSYSEAMNVSLESNTDGSPSTADMVEPESMLIMVGSAETQDEPESGYSEATTASLYSNTDGSPSTATTVEPKSMLIMLGNVETLDEPDSCYSEAMDASLDSNTDEPPSTAYTVDEESSSKSSSSFYSEVNGSVPDVKREENSGPTVDVDAKSHFTNEHEGVDVNFSLPRDTVDDSQHSEPVYDSSPPVIERFHSFSHFPSDMHVDVVEIGPNPGDVQNASDKTEGESLQKNAPDYEMFTSASLVHTKNGNRSVNQEVTEFMGIREANPSLVNGEIGSQNGPESSTEHASTSLSSHPSWDESIAEGRIHQLGSHDEHGNVHLLSSDAEGFDAAHHPLHERQDGFISPSSLKELEVSKLERLPSSGIEHKSTIDVDIGIKKGVDLVEVVTTEQGGTHQSTAGGPVQEGMELKVDNIQVEHSVYSSDVKEDESLIQEVVLEAVNLPSKKEPSRLADLQYQGNSIVKEESATEGDGAGEDDTPEIFESGATSLSDILTTSPHSVPTSEGTLEFLLPTGALNYSDDSVWGVGFVNHDRVLEYTEHMEEAADSVGDVRVRETNDRSADAELAPFAVYRADRTDSPYCPSETGEVRLTEDNSPASVHLHEGANANVKMVSESSGTNMDHGDLKNQVEENSGFSLTRHVEVEETSDIVEEFSPVKDDSNDLPVMEADEMSSSGHVNSTNEVAATVAYTEMIKLYGLENNLSLPVLEAGSVEDINMVFEQFREGANVEEIILPISAWDKTGKDEPQSFEKSSPSLQVLEPRSLGHMKSISLDEYNQRHDNMHSDDRPAENVASDLDNSAVPSNANNAESDFEGSRNASFEKAGASVESESTSSMPVLEEASRGDTGAINGLSNTEANAKDDVLPPFSSGLSMEVLRRQDGNGSTTRDVGSNETVHLHLVTTVETGQEVAADNTKYIGVEPDPQKSDSCDGLMLDIPK